MMIMVITIPYLRYPQNRCSRKRPQRRARRFIGQGECHHYHLDDRPLLQIIILKALALDHHDHHNHHHDNDDNPQALALEKSVAELSVKAVQSEQDVVSVIILFLIIVSIILPIIILIIIVVVLIINKG